MDGREVEQALRERKDENECQDPHRASEHEPERGVWCAKALNDGENRGSVRQQNDQECRETIGSIRAVSARLPLAS